MTHRITNSTRHADNGAIGLMLVTAMWFCGTFIGIGWIVYKAIW